MFNSSCVVVVVVVIVAAAAAAQALHLANQPPQQQMYSALAPTPPSMTPGPNPQSPQASFPSAQQTVYIHPQQVQHGYNHNHMAHVQQVGPDHTQTRDNGGGRGHVWGELTSAGSAELP